MQRMIFSTKKCWGNYTIPVVIFNPLSTKKFFLRYGAQILFCLIYSAKDINIDRHLGSFSKLFLQSDGRLSLMMEIFQFECSHNLIIYWGYGETYRELSNKERKLWKKENTHKFKHPDASQSSFKDRNTIFIKICQNFTFVHKIFQDVYETKTSSCWEKTCFTWIKVSRDQKWRTLRGFW